jgi:hypothetical protein
MAVERDDGAERIARIELLMSEAKRVLNMPPDGRERDRIRRQLDATLKELGAHTPLTLSPRK